MWFAILGPLLVHDGEKSVRVPNGRQRALLAVLLVRAGNAVSASALAEVVWDGAPPPGAEVTLRSHMLRLRRVLGPRAGARLVTRHPGYLLQAGQDEVDLLRFRCLCREGGAAARAGAWGRAQVLLGEALELWRGAPLVDIASESLRRDEVPDLEALRLQAEEWRIDAALHLGGHAEVEPALRSLAARHPLRERFHSQLMLALYRCGRQAEALAAYQRARGVLVEELGVEPGPGLQELHQQILSADPALTAAEPARPAVATPQWAVPRELPPTVPGFTGRSAELQALTRLVDRPGGQAAEAVVISAIGGTAGVGKTALAVAWAHQAAGRFPDGQLYVNLRGYDPGQPVPAADALAGFLRSLGVPGQDIPPEEAERAARCRSLLAGKRMLIVLDNAGSADQVRPLLPGSPSCTVLVTSRDALAGLVARDGATRLGLDVLPLQDAVALLRTLIGPQADAEPGAAAELALQCCQLPLALRIAAELAAARPAIRLAELAGELAGLQQRLDLLDAAGDGCTAIRAVFSWSYQNLTQSAARLFRLTGLHPGADVTVHGAASLASTTPAKAKRLLAELARAHLLTEQTPGRFGCHDLLRAYALDQATTTGSGAARRAALDRLLDYYLHTAAAADRLLYPLRRPIALPAPRPGVTPEGLANHPQALAWLDAEHRGLLAAVSLAAGHGYDVHVWQLAFSLETFFYRRGHWHDWAATQHAALAAADRLDDRYAQTLAHSGIANALVQTGRPADALGHLDSALRLYERAGDLYGQARVHLYTGRALEFLGRHREALAHNRQALRLTQTVGAPAQSMQAEALNHLGWELAKLGRYPQALRYCQQAVALTQQLGNKHHQPPALDSLAYVYRHLGHLAEAADCYRRAVELFDELGHRYQKAETLVYTGDAHHADGNPTAARQAWTQALAIFQALHHPDAEPLRAKLHQPTRSANRQNDPQQPHPGDKRSSVS